MPRPTLLPILSVLMSYTALAAQGPAPTPGILTPVAVPNTTTAAAAAEAARAVAAAGGLLTLEHAYDLAAASDQSLKIAFLAVRTAELSPLSALTKLTPRLAGTGGYERVSTSAAYTSNSSGHKPSAYSHPQNGNHNGFSSMAVTLEQPLLDMSVFPARRKGKLAVESSRLGRQYTIRETLFGVAGAYFEVLKGERVVEVNRESLALAQEQQSLAQKRADVGEVTRSDVLRAQVSVEIARRELITSENALEFNRNTLRNILNLAPDSVLRLAEPLPYRRDVPEFGPLLAKAYDLREDLREQTLAIQQAEQERQEIRASYAPTIKATAGPSFSQTSGRGSPGGREEWSAGVSVSVPFFTGGQREINLVKSKYAIENEVLIREQVAKKIESEVKAAWLDVQSLEGKLRAVRVQVQAAEQSYKDIQNQYSAGTAKSVDVLSALKDLSQARSDMATLSLDYQVALRNLEQVSGTFQEQRVRQIVAK